MENFIFLILKIFLYGILINSEIKNVFSSSLVENRLPDSVKPINYDIKISLLENNNFDYHGESFIEIQVKKKLNFIILHARDLEIDEEITISSGNFTQKAVGYKIEDDFLIAEFREEIFEGIYFLHLKYRGKISEESHGFYRSNYTDIFGKNKWMISTHLEAIYARNVFPCWDEPGIKSTFEISIKHNRKYTALSNTQFIKISSAENSSSEVWTCFEKTPKMSTYLVAFVVGDLDNLSSISSEDDKFSFRVWTRKNSVSRGENLLEIGKKALEFMENFTGISYRDQGMKKLDFVTVPNMHSLAVENWGLVFFSEPKVLFGKNISSAQEEDVYSIVAHELSHQWFGNLVTHEWWQFLWITEGLGSYFSLLINEQIQKSWRAMDYFLVQRDIMFNLDSSQIASPLNHTYGKDSWNVADFKFYYMNYVKPVFIFRMMRNIIGEEKFKIGLRNYLQNYKFKSATPEDFIKEIVKVSGDKILGEAFVNWENTPGYPVVTITRNYSSNTATVTQSRHLLDRKLNSTDKFWIPLNFATENLPDFDNTSVTHWFDPNKNSLDISAPEEDKWIICNKQQYGYYRVNYDERNWKLIINYLKSPNYYKIHYLNRAELIDSAFVLAESGHLSYSIPFELMEYLEQEEDSVPWAVFWKRMNHLYPNSPLRYSSYLEKFKKNVLKSFSEVEKTINYDQSHNILTKKFIKEKLLEITCVFGSSTCSNYSFSITKKWLEDPKKKQTSKRKYRQAVQCAPLSKRKNNQ